MILCLNFLKYTFYNCSSLKSIVIPDSVRSIGDNAFYGCNDLITVCYGGTIDNWGDMFVIGSSNIALTNATIYYYSETQPTAEGNYWHYVDGVPTVWGAVQS